MPVTGRPRQGGWLAWAAVLQGSAPGRAASLAGLHRLRFLLFHRRVKAEALARNARHPRCSTAWRSWATPPSCTRRTRNGMASGRPEATLSEISPGPSGAFRNPFSDSLSQGHSMSALPLPDCGINWRHKSMLRSKGTPLSSDSRLLPSNPGFS